MKKWLFFPLAACSLLAHADAALLARPDVQRYIDEQVATGEFARPDLEALFANVELKPSIITALDKPSTSRPWYQFHPNFLTSKMVDGGVAFWTQHAALLNKVEARYGVPPEMVVAILGIETRYGGNTGSFRVADALTTIGFDYPRRAAYFRGKLTEFLKLAKEEGKNPLLLKGSYAGAMGWPQFMPSSYRKWAVDFDGDGKRDIWSSPADVTGSIGNYFKLHGWQKGDDVVIPADVVPGPQIDKLVSDKFNLHYTVGELKKMGVIPRAEVADNVPAVLFPLEVAPGEVQYWLGLGNFYTITRYNRSTLYAKVAQELAEQIREAYLAQQAAAAPGAKS